MLISVRADRRIWWFTMSMAADRSSNMRTDDLASFPLTAVFLSLTAVQFQWTDRSGNQTGLDQLHYFKRASLRYGWKLYTVGPWIGRVIVRSACTFQLEMYVGLVVSRVGYFGPAWTLWGIYPKTKKSISPTWSQAWLWWLRRAWRDWDWQVMGRLERGGGRSSSVRWRKAASDAPK